MASVQSAANDVGTGAGARSRPRGGRWKLILLAPAAVAGFALGSDGLQLGTLLAMSLLSIGAVFYGASLGAARNRSA